MLKRKPRVSYETGETDMTKKKMHATDYKCCVCGKQAVCFWPVIDPDIPAHPYCRECVERAKNSLLDKIFKTYKKEEKRHESR